MSEFNNTNYKTNLLKLCKQYNYNINFNDDRIIFIQNNLDKSDKNKESGDRIAILITGLARYYERSTKTIVEFINKYKKVDIFCTFWNITGKYNNLLKQERYKGGKNSNVFVNKNWFDEDIISINNIENIIIYLKPVKMEFLNYSIYEQKFLDQINSLNKYIGSLGYTKMCMSQSFILNQGMKLFCDININKKYKYFFKIRLDMIIKFYIKLSDVENNLCVAWGNWISTANRYINIYGNKMIPSMSDQMCFTDNIEYFKCYCSFYDDINNIIIELNNISDWTKKNTNEKYNAACNYETALGYYIKYKCKIKVKELMIKSGLERDDHILMFDYDKYIHKSSCIHIATYDKMVT